MQRVHRKRRGSGTCKAGSKEHHRHPPQAAPHSSSATSPSASSSSLSGSSVDSDGGASNNSNNSNSSSNIRKKRESTTTTKEVCYEDIVQDRGVAGHVGSGMLDPIGACDIEEDAVVRSILRMQLESTKQIPPEH